MRNHFIALPLIALAAAGCASAQAKGKPADRPALMVPAPPPRIIEPAEVMEPVAELPPTNGPSVTPPPRPGRPASRGAPPKPVASEAKPEAKPGEVTPPVEPAPVPATPPAQLRTPQTADTSAAAKTVRTTIETARGILNGVKFGPLSNVRKKAFNDAKLLLQQAEDAVKEGNLAFAQGLANKAETLAKELAGR